MNRNKRHIIYGWLIILLLFCSCKKEKEKSDQAIGSWVTENKDKESDLDIIQQSGDLIIGTLSGPDTYYEYHGREVGLQYELAQNFAEKMGLRIRADVAKDTLELLKKLKNGDIDVIALELPVKSDWNRRYIYCGVKGNNTGWLVKKSSPMLAEELNNWYSPEVRKAVQMGYVKQMSSPIVKRHMRAPMLSAKKGIISNYDHLFQRYSPRIGWDWRLMAAQCYQESGFDPDAVSWAGARGLMQVMPSTAGQLGMPLSSIHNPEENVAVAAQYLGKLDRYFGDIADRSERTYFVLGAYNGGYFHIRDAMALARKHGKNASSWGDVSYFVLHLAEANYYNDPVVKHGYMRGSETYNYVMRIRDRWSSYRGAVVTPHGGGFFAPAPATKRNRYNKKNVIVVPEEIKAERRSRSEAAAAATPAENTQP